MTTDNHFATGGYWAYGSYGIDLARAARIRPLISNGGAIVGAAGANGYRQEISFSFYHRAGRCCHLASPQPFDRGRTAERRRENPP